jgi:hypothetical protein
VVAAVMVVLAQMLLTKLVEMVEQVQTPILLGLQQPALVIADILHQVVAVVRITLVTHKELQVLVVVLRLDQVAVTLQMLWLTQVAVLVELVLLVAAPVVMVALVLLSFDMQSKETL